MELLRVAFIAPMTKILMVTKIKTMRCNKNANNLYKNYGLYNCSWFSKNRQQ